jgi:hypothetical protein
VDDCDFYKSSVACNKDYITLRGCQWNASAGGGTCVRKDEDPNVIYEQTSFIGTESYDGKRFSVDSRYLNQPGALISTDVTALTVSKCLFSRCRADRMFGQKFSCIAVRVVSNGTVTISNSNFTDCIEAAIGIDLRGQGAVKIDAVIIRNIHSSQFAGLNLNASGNSSLTISKTRFENIVVSTNIRGAAILLDFNEVRIFTMEISDSAIYDSKTHGMGAGGFGTTGRLDTFNVTLRRCCFGMNVGPSASDIDSRAIVQYINQNIVNTYSNSTAPRAYPETIDLGPGQCQANFGPDPVPGPDPDNPTNTGLTSSQIAGIVVGVLAAVVLCIVGVLVFCHIRRRPKKAVYRELSSQSAAYHLKEPLSDGKL